jgi:isopentenyl-diphosphate delta-isomerase
MNTENELILVDLDDRETGRGEKTDVHRRGLLHRAFSLFLFVKTYTLYEFAGKYHTV